MKVLLLSLLTLSVISFGGCAHHHKGKSCCSKEKKAKCAKKCDMKKKKDCKDKKHCKTKKKTEA